MKNNNILISIVVIAAILIIAIYQSVYIVPEGFQSIITQFGKPIGKAKVEAGLYFKTPFIQKVIYLEKRMLNWDGIPNQIPTKDKKFILVDTTARWKITDPLLYIMTVQNDRGAKARLDAVIEATTRDMIANHNLVETVRNTNNIINKINERVSRQKKGIFQSGEEEIVGEIEPITIGREKLASYIVKGAQPELKKFGIQLIDVQLKRIAYEDSVQRKVFDRMISERKRIAEKIRSFGKGQQAEIEGKTDLELKKIESEAYRTSKEIKGKAEAVQYAIYAKAFKQDPDFYEFLRTLEAYDEAFSEDFNFILSTDSKFFNVLKNGK
ncbi:MAG: protease modulator HflC [Pseudomonadota bacterium]